MLIQRRYLDFILGTRLLKEALSGSTWLRALLKSAVGTQAQSAWTGPTVLDVNLQNCKCKPCGQTAVPKIALRESKAIFGGIAWRAEQGRRQFKLATDPTSWSFCTPNAPHAPLWAPCQCSSATWLAYGGLPSQTLRKAEGPISRTSHKRLIF